ncbi:hypothetical protein SLS59_008305 [Nothophoma quercina]|uniref:PXA domain-containing protein n=1 Tax=Nothophoma quercina TaxID=749835 RepID=A0ABR3QT86_9PLEO
MFFSEMLYGIISVIIKEFVQTWYSKITPDHVFVNEVIQVIAHCTRALEQRLRKVDLEGLMLDEIPGLLEEHLIAFRLAKQQASSPQSLVSDPRLIYHTLYPHPALAPVPADAVPSTYVEQRENESAWRQLIIQGVLAVLLPTDDLNNGCLRSLVAEIFAEMILGNGISGKACEGWLLWEAIGRIADILQTDHVQEKDPSSDDGAADEELSRLERFGLLPSQAEIPTGEETKEIKRRCAASLLGLLPPKMAVAFFASDSKVVQHQQVEEILECLEDTYLNKHLVFQILELIVLRLAPELEQQGIRDLMEERTG